MYGSLVPRLSPPFLQAYFCFCNYCTGLVICYMPSLHITLQSDPSVGGNDRHTGYTGNKDAKISGALG